MNNKPKMYSFSPITGYQVSTLFSIDGEHVTIAQAITDSHGSVVISKQTHNKDTGKTVQTYKDVIRHPLVRVKSQSFVVYSAAQATLFLELASNVTCQQDKNYLADNYSLDTLELASMFPNLTGYVKSQDSAPMISQERWLVYIAQCKKYIKDTSDAQLIADCNNGIVTMIPATNRLEDILK